MVATRHSTRPCSTSQAKPLVTSCATRSFTVLKILPRGSRPGNPLPGPAWEYISITATIYLASIFALLVGALYWPAAHRWGAYAALALGALGPLTFLLVNRPGAERIAPEWAGLAAFGLAFGGLFFGSLVGRTWRRERADGPAQNKA